MPSSKSSRSILNTNKKHNKNKFPDPIRTILVIIIIVSFFQVEYVQIKISQLLLNHNYPIPITQKTSIFLTVITLYLYYILFILYSNPIQFVKSLNHPIMSFLSTTLYVFIIIFIIYLIVLGYKKYSYVFHPYRRFFKKKK